MCLMKKGEQTAGYLCDECGVTLMKDCGRCDWESCCHLTRTKFLPPSNLDPEINFKIDPKILSLPTPKFIGNMIESRRKLHESIKKVNDEEKQNRKPVNIDEVEAITLKDLSMSSRGIFLSPIGNMFGVGGTLSIIEIDREFVPVYHGKELVIKKLIDEGKSVNYEIRVLMGQPLKPYPIVDEKTGLRLIEISWGTLIDE